MKRTLLFFIALLGIVTAYAEDYTYLTIVGTDGSKTSLTAVGLSLSFDSENLTASNAYTGESKVIALTSLVSMNFSNADETTGIVDIEHETLNIEHSSDAVYDLQGRRVASSMFNIQYSIFNLQRSMLKKGIYIIRKGNVTQKLQVR